MSGFAITLDALVAVVAASLIVAAATELLAGRDFNQDDYLVRYGYDLLAVAEKNGMLDELITTPTIPTKFSTLLEDITKSICIEAEMTFPDKKLYYHADNYDVEGAKCKKYEDFASVSRVVVHEGQIFPITLKMWYG